VALCVIAFNNYCTKLRKPVRRNHYGRRGEKNSHVKALLLLCFSTLISSGYFNNIDYKFFRGSPMYLKKSYLGQNQKDELA